MSARDWEASTYDRVATGVFAVGVPVADRLELRGDETVLDAGCGSGRVTETLLDRLPDGHVIAVDGAPSMIAAARERIGDRAELLCQDLLRLDIGERQVDAILSTATFHWIADHGELFAVLRSVLRPGGRLVAQCGGAGNIASVRAAIDDAAGELGVSVTHPWRFATPEETEALLLEHSFGEVSCWLERTEIRTAEPVAYLRSVILGEHLPQVAVNQRDAFVAAIARRLPQPPAPLFNDYIRLNIQATAV